MSPMHRIMKVLRIKKSKRIPRKDGQAREFQLLNPRSSPPQSSSLIKSNIKNITLRSTLTLTKSIPIQISINRSIDKATSYQHFLNIYRSSNWNNHQTISLTNTSHKNRPPIRKYELVPLINRSN